MSVVTNIIGWIETDGYEKEHNNKILKELEYTDTFIKMFCSPKETGSKNPDFIMFGASINFCNFEEWLEKFESFIKKLKAFGAFVHIQTESQQDKTFVIGYSLGYGIYNGKFNRKFINFGEPFQYSLDTENETFEYPLLFEILANYK